MRRRRESSAAQVRAERGFGWMLGGVLSLLGGWWLWRGAGGAAALAILAIGLSLVFLALVSPGSLRLALYVWTKLTRPLGALLTHAALALVFYMVVTPVALARRLAGSDPLGRRGPAPATGWQPCSTRRPDHFERMY